MRWDGRRACGAGNAKGNLLFPSLEVARDARLLQSSFLLLECELHSAVAVATEGNKMDSAVQQKVERKKCRECELKPSFGRERGVELPWDSEYTEVAGSLRVSGLKERAYGD